MPPAYCLGMQDAAARCLETVETDTVRIVLQRGLSSHCGLPDLRCTRSERPVETDGASRARRYEQMKLRHKEEQMKAAARFGLPGGMGAAKFVQHCLQTSRVRVSLEEAMKLKHKEEQMKKQRRPRKKTQSATAQQRIAALDQRLTAFEAEAGEDVGKILQRLTLLDVHVEEAHRRIAALEVDTHPQVNVRAALSDDLGRMNERLDRIAEIVHHQIIDRLNNLEAANVRTRERLDSARPLGWQSSHDSLTKQVAQISDLSQTTAERLIALSNEVAKLEDLRALVKPQYRREGGETVAIADMNDHHLKNAILKCLRGERRISEVDEDGVPPETFKALCVEAGRRGLDWQSWTSSTEPVTKYATRD